MLGPHMVTLIEPAGRDEWGDVQSGAVETTVAGCFWQPESSSEDTDARDTVNTLARCFMPASAPKAPTVTMRLRFRGVEYQVEGEPSLFDTPSGPHHYEIQLRRVVG